MLCDVPFFSVVPTAGEARPNENSSLLGGRGRGTRQSSRPGLRDSGTPGLQWQAAHSSQHSKALTETWETACGLKWTGGT